MRSAMRSVGKAQRKLMSELSTAVTRQVELPAEPRTIFEALCTAMSHRRGRPVVLHIREFPKEIANSTTGLWLDLAEQDVVVVEKGLAPDHQLVVLGHELWHMHAGHCGHEIGGAAVAARAALASEADWPEVARRVAARSHSQQVEEVAAETFGLLLGSHMRTWLVEADDTGVRHLDDVARRINASLGYPGPQG
ncbi:toxin-antitoxin system, toxin component [Streptomyces glomeratus]|uniref:Toxin-antitoxin system, toxin component n=1 Tax=Streptomyces glomeratus TaxID=284452 RepID=A0ABP6M738_9ACTN|nr:toxin-antitoxin system, toxin component [Streptomyces glomeratus]